MSDSCRGKQEAGRAHRLDGLYNTRVLHKEREEREGRLPDARVFGGDPVGDGRHEPRARCAADIGRPVPEHLAQQLQRLPAPQHQEPCHSYIEIRYL